MSPLILFSGMVLVILLIIFGVFLSSHINNSTELLLFWMLYVITVITILTLFSSFYINMILKDKTGIIGKKGKQGDKGVPGDDGRCEPGCRNDICFNIILREIEERIGELINNNLNEDENRIKDYLRFINSRRYRNDNTGDIIVLSPNGFSKDKKNQTIVVIKTIINKNKKQDKEIKDLIRDKIKKNKLEDIYNKAFPINRKKQTTFILNNLYVKQLIKRICHSDEFKEVSAIKGPQYLIEYIKDIMLDWVDLIFKEGGELYFKTIGAENDFEWREVNPFNEIKKYDLFYWGAPNNTRPRLISSIPKFGKKFETNLDGKIKIAEADSFQDYNQDEEREVSIIQNRLNEIVNDDTITTKLNNNEYGNIYNSKLTGEERTIPLISAKKIYLNCNKKNAGDDSISGLDSHNNRVNKLKILVSNEYALTYHDKNTNISSNLSVYRPRKKIHAGDEYFPLGDIAFLDTSVSMNNKPQKYIYHTDDVRLYSNSQTIETNNFIKEQLNKIIQTKPDEQNKETYDKKLNEIKYNVKNNVKNNNKIVPVKKIINDYLIELKKDGELYASRPGKEENRLLRKVNKNTFGWGGGFVTNLFVDKGTFKREKTSTPIVKGPLFDYNACDVQEENESQDMFKIVYGYDVYGNIFIEEGLDKETKLFINNVRKIINEYNERPEIHYDTSEVNRDKIVNNKQFVNYPDKPTILVAGDVKPATYKHFWYEHQQRLWKHLPTGLWLFGMDAPHHGVHKGQAFKLSCPNGYEALGNAIGSTYNLNTTYNKNGTGKPIGTEYQHVCIPKDCVERIPNNTIETDLWYTHNADRNFMTGSKYNLLRVNNIKDDDKYPRHKNSYNLFSMDNLDNPEFKRIKDECITKIEPIQMNGQDGGFPNMDGHKSSTKHKIPSKTSMIHDTTNTNEGFKSGEFNEDPYTYYKDKDDNSNYFKDIEFELEKTKDELRMMSKKNTRFKELNLKKKYTNL